jgi:hypothetical protein
LSDAHDIITLNRAYNEISTDIADIVNYHAAPVTVIVGAKASNLEKGAKKVWGGLPKDAQVFNLEGGGSGLQGAMEYLRMLKTSMHELMNVPETALGQMQPISNTSGVALSIQYQPLMNRWSQKTAQYGAGLARVNELVMLTLAVKEPETFVYDPEQDGPIKEGQVTQLDPNDHVTYKTYTQFNDPLPLDKLIMLNELQMKMTMGLESKEGALRLLGHEFPDEKLAEVRKEMQEDAEADGALNLVKVLIQKTIVDLTGMMPGPDGSAMPMDPMMMGDGDVLGDGIAGPAAAGPTPADAQLSGLIGGTEEELRVRLVEAAYGTKLPSRRVVDKDD